MRLTALGALFAVTLTWGPGALALTLAHALAHALAPLTGAMR